MRARKVTIGTNGSGPAATLYRADCLDVLPRLADASLCAVISDPCYGTTAAPWDTGLPSADWWRQCWRCLPMDGPICLTACGQALPDLIVAQRQFYRLKIVWHRDGQSTGFLHARRAPLRTHEDVLIFARRAPQYRPWMTRGKRYVKDGGANGSELYRPIGTAPKYSSTFRYPKDVLRIKPPSRNSRIISCQKPVQLFANLVRWYVRSRRICLDPFMGSGTTGVACIETGRRFIGIELDPEHFEAAVARLRAAWKEKEASQRPARRAA